MIIDIIVLIVILLSAVFGARKGFVATIISFTQWFACLIIALFAVSPVKNLIYKHTQIDEYLTSAIGNRLGSSVESSPTYTSVPDLFSGWLQEGSQAAVTAVSETITSIILTVISFILIILLIKLICYVLMHSLSKKHHKGFIAFADSVGGFAIGLFRGGIYVFLGFAILIPVLGMIWPDLSNIIMDSLNASRFSGELYNNNILLRIIADFFS